MKKERRIFGKDIQNNNNCIKKNKQNLHKSRKTLKNKNRENKENTNQNTNSNILGKNPKKFSFFQKKKINAVDKYLNQIICHLQKTNGKNLTLSDPFKNQLEINKRMRGILINWLLEVHMKFNLKLRTMFLTCNILDRFLEFKHIPKKKLQLVGIASFLIASKYEDIYPPEIDDFCYLCENIFTKNDIIECESEILSFLNFDLIFVSAFDVGEYFLKIYNDESENLRKMTCLILELFLFHSDSGRFDSFKLAAFAMNFANLIINFNEIKTFKNFISIKEKNLFIQELKGISSAIKIDQLTALENKYKGTFLKLLYSSHLFN